MIFRHSGPLLSVLLFLSLVDDLPAKLRVATYNVRNYLMTDRLVPGKPGDKLIWRKNYPKPEIEKKALRRIIAKVDPDILALQEMGGAPYLKEFQRDLEHVEGVSYPHSALMLGADEDRHVAVLSKIPFNQVVQHKSLSHKYFGQNEIVRRGLLEVQFNTNGLDWSLFNLHLKSKWTERKDDPEASLKREGEATAVREFLKKKHPVSDGHPYLLVGDFNDTPNSKPLARILRSGNNRLCRYIYCQDERGRIWSHYWRKGGLYSQIDYICASFGMLDLYKLPEGQWPSGNIEDSSDSMLASDHRMVWVDLPF